jgi:hypothetical protein
MSCVATFHVGPVDTRLPVDIPGYVCGAIFSQFVLIFRNLHRSRFATVRKVYLDRKEGGGDTALALVSAMEPSGQMLRPTNQKGTGIMRAPPFDDRSLTQSTTLDPRERRSVCQARSIGLLYMACLFGAITVAHALFDATPQNARDAVEAAFIRF